MILQCPKCAVIVAAPDGTRVVVRCPKCDTRYVVTVIPIAKES